MATKSSKRVKRKLTKLFMQQEGKCWICGMPMRLSLSERRSRFDASLDHIIPRSKGGTFGMCNLKASHKSCNNARGSDDRVDSLLRHVEKMKVMLSCPILIKMLGVSK